MFKSVPSSVPDLHKKAKRSKATIQCYWDKFYTILSAGNQVDVEEILNLFPNVKEQTVRKNLKQFIDFAPGYLIQINGL